METIVFCLPYAGGSRLSFKGMEKRNKTIKFIPIEYITFNDRFVDNNDNIIKKCCDIIINHNIKDYYILGYSMGAIIGYEVIKALEERLYQSPLGLIVISCNSPDIGIPKLLNDEELKCDSEIISIGGVPKSLYEDPEMLDFFLSIIKYDLKILLALLNKCNFKAINTDIILFWGAYDNIIEPNTCLNWGKFTNTNYYFNKLNDGHFINENSEKIIINGILKHNELKEERYYEQNTHILF